MTISNAESNILCDKAAPCASLRFDLSPIWKSTCVCLLDFHHVINGERQNVGNRRNVVDFLKRQHPALAGLQIFIEYLISTDVEVPYRLRYWLETLRLIDRNGMLCGRIADRLYYVIALPLIRGQTSGCYLAK